MDQYTTNVFQPKALKINILYKFTFIFRRINLKFQWKQIRFIFILLLLFLKLFLLNSNLYPIRKFKILAINDL